MSYPIPTVFTVTIRYLVAQVPGDPSHTSTVITTVVQNVPLGILSGYSLRICIKQKFPESLYPLFYSLFFDISSNFYFISLPSRYFCTSHFQCIEFQTYSGPHLLHSDVCMSSYPYRSGSPTLMSKTSVSLDLNLGVREWVVSTSKYLQWIQNYRIKEVNNFSYHLIGVS